MWNNAALKCPPVNTHKDSANAIDCTRLHTIVSDAVSILEKQESLHQEAALVSRLVYVMGRKFRHDIGHSYVRRTNVALLKYLNLEFLKDLKTFLSIVPESSSNYVYLPTRQMLEFILIRIQTFARIIFRIVVCSKNAAIFYFERVKRGDSAWLSLLPYSVLSRVWQLSNRLVRNACIWYNNLISFKDNLKVIGLPLSPIDYIFPSNLLSWIGIDQYEMESNVIWKSGAHNVLSSFIDSITPEVFDKSSLEYEDTVAKIIQNNGIDSENNLSDLTSNDSDDSNNKSKINLRHNVVPKNIANNNIDIGMKVTRKEFVKSIKNKNKIDSKMKKLDKSNSSVKEDAIIKATLDKSRFNIKGLKNKAANKTNKHIHSIDEISNSKSIVEFLKREESLRLSNDQQSLTQGISFMQWQSLKNVLLKLSQKIKKCNSPEKQDKIVNKLKEFWNERCVE